MSATQTLATCSSQNSKCASLLRLSRHHVDVTQPLQDVSSTFFADNVVASHRAEKRPYNWLRGPVLGGPPIKLIIDNIIPTFKCSRKKYEKCI